MNGGRLTPAQLEVLRALAGLVPAWRLAGGAALAGFHTRHRGTRDLDLFWLGKELGQVDQPHEILVTKLCALLSRSELRDLEDVRALLDAGGDLARALADAPRKEAAFSPVTLAWVLEQLPIAAMGRALGRAADEARGLEVFRQGLVGMILAAAKPG